MPTHYLHNWLKIGCEVVSLKHRLLSTSLKNLILFRGQVRRLPGRFNGGYNDANVLGYYSLWL
jgi:hypothetical protein